MKYTSIAQKYEAILKKQMCMLVWIINTVTEAEENFKNQTKWRLFLYVDFFLNYFFYFLAGLPKFQKL